MRALPSALRRSAAAALAALGFLALAGTLGAQTTTGGIRGRVTDPAETPLPGATVVAVNEQTGFSNGAQSDDQGIYTIRLLPPGTYRVTARRLGSQQVEIANVRVVLSTNTTQNFTLVPVAVTLEGVQVTADRPVDATETGVSQTVTTEQIANLPTLGRDFTDFINLSGLVSPTPEATTGGQFSIAGQRPSQTSIQIDGVDANNAFFGENRGGSRIPFNFSLESIREFQIVTNGYDVEYGNYSGGVINIVTKSGGNDFQGSFYGNYRGDALTAQNFDGSEPRNFEVQQYAGQVSGPIVKDKLFYLFSLDGQRRREPFRPLSADTERATDPAFADALERYYDILENQYGIAGAAGTYDEFETTNDVLTLFGRVDWTISQANRLSLRHNFSDYDNLNEGSSPRGGRSQHEAFKNTTNSLVGELTSSFGESMANVFRFQWSSEDRPRIGNELRPEIVVRNVVPGESIEYGGAFIAFDNRLAEDKVQLVDNFTWQAGSHSVKLGTNNIFTHVTNDFWLNGSGGFEFADLDALEAGRPTRYTRNVTRDGRAPTAEFDVQEYSLYLQDEWQAAPKIFVSAGLRYDVARYADAPRRVVEVEQAFGVETGLAPIDKNNVSPRLSVTYDVNGDATQLVRGGIGLFYGRVPYVLGGNVAQTEVPLLSLVCEGNIDDADPDAPQNPLVAGGGYGSWDPSGADNPASCLNSGDLAGVPEYSFWNPDFELPETIKANLGYERLVGENTKLTIDYIYTASNKLYTVRNINLRDAQFELANEGGRNVFVPAGQFAPSSSAGPARLRNTDFDEIFVNYNDGVARSHAASVALDHRFTDDITVQGSYTYTRAFDNSSFSCCTSFAGLGDRRIGQLGPNVPGGVGDEDAGWGASDFVRNHTFVVSGFAELPWDVRVSAVWRLQSGTPWGPEQSGDINGDGISFNDRPFIFAPEDLPISPGSGTPAEQLENVAQQRARYASYLADNECIGDYVGQIIPRNTCRQPWFNRLDVSLRKRFETVSSQSAELSIDLFNVLNGLNSDWGQYEAVTTQRRNLLAPQSYDPASEQILYTVPSGFGNKTTLGTNLLLQFSAQVGLRYYF
ncbi:MAG TPA: TonB-dependent receptor [Gemmatimonadaceae bacterium]